jgi:hypothetical protein
MAMGATATREGRCLCGAIRYRVTGEPIWVGHCHCETCRRSCSAAFATFAGFPRERFEILSGSPGIYRSSPGVERRFCRDCGSPLTYEGARWPTETHILLCSLEDPAALQPTFHTRTAEQLPWVHLADGLARQ